jgi:hypothetical protein
MKFKVHLMILLTLGISLAVGSSSMLAMIPHPNLNTGAKWQHTQAYQPAQQTSSVKQSAQVQAQ